MTTAARSVRKPVRSRAKSAKNVKKNKKTNLLTRIVRAVPPRLFPAIFGAGVIVGVVGMSYFNRAVNDVRGRVEALITGRAAELAPLFTAEVDYWGHDIVRWANNYSLDPNLLATVMQIESCGHADVSSSAGAQGLFQVMPFHFDTGEVMTDPETNARRGASFLAQCMGYASGDPRLAMACYNGGPSVINRDFSNWAHETQRYYVWGSTIYQDAQQNVSHSDSLQHWLDAGGSSLCQRAAQNISQRSAAPALQEVG